MFVQKLCSSVRLLSVKLNSSRGNLISDRPECPLDGSAYPKP